jgi:hypothetical protein
MNDARHRTNYDKGTKPKDKEPNNSPTDELYGTACGIDVRKALRCSAQRTNLRRFMNFFAAAAAEYHRHYVFPR